MAAADVTFGSVGGTLECSTTAFRCTLDNVPQVTVTHIDGDPIVISLNNDKASISGDGLQRPGEFILNKGDSLLLPAVQSRFDRKVLAGGAAAKLWVIPLHA